MTISYGAKLIIGWSLDHEKLKEWKKEIGIIPCCSKKGYICECDDFGDKLPKNFILVSTNPYFDCGYDKKHIFLSYFIKGLDNHFYDPSSSFEIKKITEIFKDVESFDNAKTFVEKMGGSGEPEVMAIPHVY